VHGRDDLSLLELKDFIQNSLGWRTPIVLRDQPNCGRTIIEKFESFASRIDWVFVLLTPDDQVVARIATDDEKRRARQNVVFEMGYFYGKLDRLKGRVIALVKEPIEMPSDISGIVWITIENGVKSAAEAIRNEIAQIRPDFM
jgi:predicted nucleotide-binding protein